ncbi:MAG TPA: cytochrome c oxidase assembly protein, partial [Chloroflexota bacterium]|nr:cytochrome c oxidase assembly protein [Chloroflexota bacterium]
ALSSSLSHLAWYNAVARAPSTQELLTRWTWEPSVIVGLILLIAGYIYAVGPLRRRRELGPPASSAQITYFALSVGVLVIALLSPLDYVGDHYLFSAHMVQHLLLAALWPPLVILSIPSWLAAALFRRRVLAAIALFLTYPAFTTIAFNADIYLWHAPPLYDRTLTDEAVHVLEHVTFMAFGLLVYWPVLSPILTQRLAYPFQLLYLFLNGMFMMVLGIVFTFAPTAFYEPYVAAPRLWSISAVTDQQVGGLIMWYPGNIPYAVLFVLAFYRWFDSGETEPVDAERLRSPSPTIGPPGP